MDHSVGKELAGWFHSELRSMAHSLVESHEVHLDKVHGPGNPKHKYICVKQISMQKYRL